MNPFIIFNPFKAAIRWLIGVEERDILTPFEQSLFGKVIGLRVVEAKPAWFPCPYCSDDSGECELCDHVGCEE